MPYFFRRERNERAQTAIELAVFGSILVFVVGLIIRQSVNYGYQQNQNLKAMRLAMTQSFEYSEGLKGPVEGRDGDDIAAGTSSRNSATVLFVEDRLSPDSSKYGSLSRVPQITSASATHSRNLFLPISEEETWNIPVMDIFINGQHFPLTTAGLVTYSVRQGAFINGKRVEWIFPCVEVYSVTGVRRHGCPRFYSQVPNHQGSSKWCYQNCIGGNPAPGERCCVVDPNADDKERINFSADRRFDLDRDGTPEGFNNIPPADPDPDVCPAGEADLACVLSERKNFSWQWYEVMGVSTQQLDEEQAWFETENKPVRGSGIDLVTGNNVSIDVDGDLKEETVISIPGVQNILTGVIQDIHVLDRQEGDIDLTITEEDVKNGARQPGFTNDMGLITLTGDGTYFFIEEGKLYDDDKQYMRQVQKKDSVDIIQRKIVLSNNTGRFCRGATPPALIDNDANQPNPVQVCASDCFSAQNIDKTCLDTDDLEIWVRSRITDLHGRKWITEWESN